MTGRNPARGAAEVAQEAPDRHAVAAARPGLVEAAVEALAGQSHELRGPDGALTTGSVVEARWSQ